MAGNITSIARKQTTLLDRAKQHVEAQPWRPTEVNDHVEGEVFKITHGGKFDSTFYHVLKDDGSTVTVAGGNTVLGKRLADEQVGVGDHVGIVYLGEGISQAGRTFKDWYVEVTKAKAEGAEPAGDVPPGEPPDDEIPF